LPFLENYFFKLFFLRKGNRKKMNKRTFILSAVMIALIALLYAAFGPALNTAESKTTTPGTIKVCWGQTCASDAVTTVVTLHDAAGNVMGSCTITPPNQCCTISGDFPTGTYYFTYYRPTGVSDCRTGTFSYTNGTDLRIAPICFCP
jgi:hypothetical protein